MSAQLVAAGADFGQDNFWIVLVKAVAILIFVLTSVIMAIWFERKVVGRMQVRPGPNVHGPFGLLQTTADAVKLLIKEDITVKAADKIVYLIAPTISVFAAFLTLAVIPFGPAVDLFGHISPLQLTDFPVAVLYILACTSVGVYGMVLGGWSSGSTYPLLGSVRSTAQVISYELVMGLSLVSVFILAGSMSTSQIVEAQQRMWYALALPIGFVLYVVSMVGETNRLPFDLPEAEGELVAGYMTEYSSMKFAWFYLAEYINMLNVSAVCTTLFLGGWRAPFPLSTIADGALNTGWWPVITFLVKVWLVMFCFVWVRGTLLRFRYDQFMNLGWKVLLPVALGWLVLVIAVQSVRQFAHVDLRTLSYVILGVLAVVGLATWLIPDKEAPPPERDDAPFDAFAAGYPVPPLPGQQVPPSARKLKAMTAAGAAATAPTGAEPATEEVDRA